MENYNLTIEILSNYDGAYCFGYVPYRVRYTVPQHVGRVYDEATGYSFQTIEAKEEIQTFQIKTYLNKIPDSSYELYNVIDNNPFAVRYFDPDAQVQNDQWYYEENGEIKKVEAIVDGIKDVEFLIAQAIAKARGNEIHTELDIQGTRMAILSPGYMIIAIVLTLGFLLIFGMLITFEIHDYNFDVEMNWREPGDINVGKLVAYSICSLLGFPIFFTVLKGFSNFRHLPLALIAYNPETEKVYLYKKRKYIVINSNDIISATRRNEKERHIDKTYQIKNFQTGRYEYFSTYRDVIVPRGTIKIKYKDASGIHTYKVHVRYVANVTLGGIVNG